MTPKEMREKRARLITEARSLRNELDGADESRAAEIETRFDAMIAEAESLQERAAKEERLAELEASLDAGDSRRPQGGESRAAGDPAPAEMTYRSAFHAMLQAGGDVHALSSEERAALQRGTVALNAEQRAQLAGNAAAGGNLVPDEAMQEIVKAMAAWGPMWDDDFARTMLTQGGGTIPIPGVDDTGNEAGETAGEGVGLGDGTDAVFTKTELGDYMRDTGWIGVSIQLMTGAPTSVEALLAELLGERLGRKANRDLTLGSGAGAPQGIVTGASASGVSVASTSALSADELVSFYHAFDPAYRASPKFRFMFNDNTLGVIHKLKDGQGNYLVNEAPDGSGRLRIGGVTVPYAVNQSMANIGANARSIVGGDFGRFWVRKIGGVILGTDRSKAFWPGMGIAGYTRFDSAVADPKAIKAFVHPAA